MLHQSDQLFAAGGFLLIYKATFLNFQSFITSFSIKLHFFPDHILLKLLILKFPVQHRNG
jgi:hypothetical protein